MKKMIWITTISVIFAVFLLPAFLAIFIKVIPSGVQPPLHKTKNIYKDFLVAQDFVSPISNLTGIATTVRNYNLLDKHDIFLDLYDDDENLIRKSRINGANIHDGDFVKFYFDNIPDSKNKKYQFVLRSPDSNEVEIFTIYYTNESPNWAGQMYFEDVKEGGSVSFVTLHKSGNKLKLIGDIYGDLFKRLFLRI